MAIDKKLIHFKTKENFNSANGVNGSVDVPTSGSEGEGNAEYGQIKGTSIVFVKDSKEIWTHGNLYKSVGWGKILYIDDILSEYGWNVDEILFNSDDNQLYITIGFEGCETEKMDIESFVITNAELCFSNGWAPVDVGYSAWWIDEAIEHSYITLGFDIESDSSIVHFDSGFIYGYYKNGDDVIGFSMYMQW